MIAPTPPNNKDAERVVLGYALASAGNARRVVAEVPAESFYQDSHQQIYAEITESLEQTGQCDSQLILSRLEAANKFGAIGGRTGYYEVLTEGALGQAQYRAHATTLRELLLRREQQRIGQELMQRAQDYECDPEGTSATYAVSLTAHSIDGRHRPMSAAEAATGALGLYQQAKAQRMADRPYAGLSTGFDGISRRINGYLPGQLTVLAARPSIGKSTWAFCSAIAVARDEQRQVGIISLEMTADQVALRLATLLADIDYGHAQRGALDPRGEQSLQGATEQLADLPITIYTAAKTPQSIAGLIEQSPDTELWIVDHLHKMRGYDAAREHERYNRYAEDLSEYAVTYKTHILLLSQLNRSCEERPDKRPNISDLRGSGGIEEHAVNVLTLYRPGYYTELVEAVSRTEGEMGVSKLVRYADLTAEKVRFGQTGREEISWSPRTASFGEIYEDTTIHY